MNLKISEAFKILKQIIKGTIKSIFKNSRTEKIAKYRLSVCSACPYQGYLINVVIFGTRIKLITQCKDCGCILKLKSRSDSTCPQNKWKA